jgi:hypothetical protein
MGEGLTGGKTKARHAGTPATTPDGRFLRSEFRNKRPARASIRPGMNPAPLSATAAATDPAPGTPTRRTLRARQFPLLCALAVAVLHFIWLTAHLAPAIMSPDANGYVVQARLMADEGRTSFSPTSPVQFVGMHWLETDNGVFHSRYPAGLPLLFAGAWKVGGIRAALLVNPLLASATVLLVFFLARRMMCDRFAVLAALVVALVPVTNQHALDADAHVAAAFFLVSGVLALLRFELTRSPIVGLIAGVLLGAIPAVRYPEAIVGLAIGAWLVWRIRPLWRAWPAVVGAAIPLGALFAHNTVAYGAFWRTGYALTNEQTGFGLSYFASHILPYLQGLSGQGLALMFAFGAAGIAALVVDPRRRSEGILFAGIAVPVVLLYMAYYFGGGGIGGAGGNLRFLIPTFPFFAAGAVWLLSRLADQLGAPGRAAVAVVAALQVIIGVGASQQTLAAAGASVGAAARARIVAEKEIPTGSVVIVERPLAESLDATGQWKLVEENLIAGGGGPGPGGFGAPGPGGPAGRGGMPGRGPVMRPPGVETPGGPEVAGDAPSPMQRGKNRAQLERYANLRPDERRARAWSDLREWAEGKPVYWFARSVDAVEAVLPAGAEFRTVAEVEAPAMMGPGGGRGPGGGGPMGPGGPMMPGRGIAPGRGVSSGQPGPMGGSAFAGGPGGRRGGGAPIGSSKLRVVRIEFGK